MDKSPDAFRTISEVAEDLELPQHVLRFWETRFTQIKPLKRGGGRRYYRPDDVDLLKGIQHFLYGEGYTIRGVQRILKAEGIRFVQAVGRGDEDGQAASGMRSVADSEDFPEAGMGGGDAGAEIEPPAAGLDGADLQRLRAALDELMECDRVLTALRAPDPVSE